MNSKFRVFWIVVTVLTICFIWGQSCISTEKSSKESKAITENVVQRIEESLTGKKTISNSVVRKWAHCIEYFILGVELFFLLKRLHILKKCITALCSGIGIALLDETIQLFSGRGASIRDVWIDSGGIFVGILLGCIVKWIAITVVRTKHEKTTD